MKKHILIICLLSPLFIFSQADSRFSIGLVFSPDYNYRTLREEEIGYTDIKNRYDNLDYPVFGYTAGVHIKYALSEHLYAGSGLQYSMKGYQTHYQALAYAGPVTAVDVLPVEAKFTYTYDFIEVPLFIEYKSGTGKLHLNFSTGATVNILVNGTVTETGRYYDGHTAEVGDAEAIDERRPVMISPFISAGLSWSITEKIDLSLSPVIRYAVTKINAEDDPLSEHLWNAGIQAGIFLDL